MPATSAGMTASMNLRLRGSLPRKQKIKIAALIGLPDMGRIHRPVTALVMRRRRAPGAAAGRPFFAGAGEVAGRRIAVVLDPSAGLAARRRSAHLAAPRA